MYVDCPEPPCDALNGVDSAVSDVMSLLAPYFAACKFVRASSALDAAVPPYDRPTGINEPVIVPPDMIGDANVLFDRVCVAVVVMNWFVSTEMVIAAEPSYVVAVLLPASTPMIPAPNNNG